MKPPVKGWKAIKSRENVYLPGGRIKTITVPAWQDARGEIYLCEPALKKLDDCKKRLLNPKNRRKNKKT